MPLDRKAWSDYGAELEQQAADAKKAAEAKPQEDGGGFLAGIAERQAEQGSDLSGEIEAEEKDYTDEEIKEQASAFQHLAKATADNVMEKLENNRTAAVYHDILEDAWQTEQDFAEAGIETHGTAVTEEDVAKAKARVNEEPLWSAAAKEAGREFIAAYADNPNSAMQSAAQGLRRTDTNIAYWMTPEERLSKAKEIEEATGINAMALLGDNEAFRSALNIYDHQQKILALRRQKGETENTSAVMAEVYKEFPGLEKLSYEDPAAAALALHDIHHVREARDTITAWKEAWNYGWLEQEYGILKDKEADGKASENDKARMAALEEQLKTEPVTPSFFEAPWLTAISGLAGSMPMMTDALTEGALWGVAGAAVGAAVSAPAGGVGAVPGFFTGGARGMVRALGRHALGRGIASGFTWGRRIGELNSMYKAQRGQDFAEYQKMTDEYGERLLSDEEAARYSQVSGAAKAAVEVAPMELFLSKFKSSPQAQKVFQRIIEQGEMDRAFRRDVLRTVTGRGKDIAEVTLAEAGEEGVQQAIGDIAHNQIEIDTGDTNPENGGIFTPEEIMARGAMATMAALPTSFLFGLIPAAASTGWDGVRFSKLGREMQKFRQEYSAEERQTMAGTVVLAELQQVTQDSRLKETSPETQRKLLREELAGTGLEVAYIDTALAQEQENGIEDIRKAGRAAGLSDEAIEDTVEAGGILAVPVECYAQSAASPELLDAVSFSAEAEPMGRMKARAEAFYEEAKARLKTTVERQKRLEETITKELFPSEGEERAMAVEAMTLNPENPAQGWREIERELSRARADELKEADEAIRKGLPEEGQAGAAWYEAWKKEHGRAPKEAEIEEMIYALATGAEDASKVERFDQSAKAANVRMAAKERLTEIDHKRKVLESIKERMMSLTGKEMQETETLTGEGFRVYRSILSDLKSADNPRVTRAARIGALLFARHADIYAAAMRRRGGELENYTAMDYYNKAFALDVSGRAKGDGAFYQEAANAQTAAERLKEDAKVWENTVDSFMKGEIKSGVNSKIMGTPLVFQLIQDDLGIPIKAGIPLKIHYGILHKILRDTKKHALDITPDMMKELPTKLADPIMILKNRHGETKEVIPGEVVCVVDMKDAKGNTVIVPIAFAYKNGAYQVKTVFGRQSTDWFTTRILMGDVLYANKEKTSAWIKPAGHQSPMGLSLGDSFYSSIKTETDLVKEKMKNPALYQGAANAQTAAERLKEDAKAWKKTLKGAWAGKLQETQMFRVMETPLVLQLVGAKALPIYMSQGKLMQIKKEHPEIKKALLNKLPEQLADPMMIFQSETVPGRIVVCLELKDEAGVNVVVPVELNAKQDRIEINVITSIYGKGKPTTGSNYGWFLDNVMKGHTLYVNKKQAANFYRAAGLQLPMEGRKFNDLFGLSIKTETDLVKEKMKNPALYQETHGETTMLENGRRIVSLFKSADESTFLHELGHVFLDDLRQLAAFDEVSQKELATVDAWTAWREGAAKEYQDTPWAAEFRGYEAAILKAQKAGDSAALEKALAVWRHERFARAFERYLKEGEAPARGLKQVFRKFAAFLRSVYRAFTSDGGRASAEVEQIMDRMIATDEEIEAAALDKRYQDITEAGGETLFSETEKETYQRWYEKAKAEAKERLARVVERKMKGDLRRKMEAEIQSEEERYQEALYQDTIQQARQAVKLAGDEKAALLFYENIEAYREADKKVPAMETLLKEHMEAYRREKEQELLASAITPEEVERAMASSEYHDRRLALEAAAFQRQAEALRRVGGRTRAAMDEVEEKIEGLAEEPGAEEIEAQKEAVRQKYQGTDMWMKAPNGQPTKLTEEDWLLVRTPAFKAWFGDWEAEYRKQENIERGIRAVEEVLHTRQDVQKAMFRSETGGIDFVYGEEGDPSKKYAGGYGIAHILAKHGQSAIDMIPTVIAKGKATQKHNDRIHFNYGGYTAVVRLDFDGNQKTWLVTNFEKYANKKDSPTAEVFARSADNPDGAHSTIGGNLSLAPTIAQKKVDGQAVSKIVDENGEPLLSGDKKAAVREFKKRISGSKEVIYWKGQSGHSRPSSETWASTLNAKLHPSGKLSIADEGEKSKGAETNRKGKAEEEAAKAKEPEGWRDLMRAIHRLRAAHRWGAEELSAIDTVAKAANKVDMKTAWAKVKALLTKAHVNEQELKEAVRGKSQLYRELARKELSAMPLSEATATLTYRRQEIEAARRVEKLVKAEKWEMAEKEKENQLLAAAMAAEARKTREKVDVIRRRVERYLKGKEKLPPSEGYWLHHLAYLLRLTEKDATKPAKLDTLAAIAAKLSAGLDIRTEGEWTPLSAAMALSASPAENGYLGMTMEDFEESARGLGILYVTGRDEGKMKTMAGRTLEEIRDEIISDPTNLLDGVTVKENKINPNEGGLGYSTLLRKAPLLGQQMASVGQRYLAATMKPELMMELLGEKAHRYLYGTLERAAQHEAAMTAEAMATVNHLVGAYTRKERQAWQERNILWWGDEKISKENILAMALNLGNEINRSRLAEGLSDLENPHIIEEIIARIEQHMTEKDWQFVQGVWDFLGKYWPETVRIEMMMNGTQLHPQPALPFTARTKDGKEIKMKGGYYPIVYNAEKSDRALEYSLDEEAKKNMQGAAALSTGLSSTKSRTKGAVKGRPLLLSLRVIPKHLGEVIHNQTHRIACRDVYHIIHDKTFSDYVTKRMGAPFYENLKQWAIDVWQTKSADLNQAERGLSKLMQGLRSNAALAIMGWRMWPVTENATNIFPAMNEIGAAEMMSAVGDFYANFGTYKELLHKSLFMSSRIEHMDRDMKRQHRMFETDAAVPEWLKDNAYLFMEKTDLMFSAPLWCRAYKNAFAPKLAEVMAENEAAKKEIETAYAEDKLAEAKVYDLVQRQKEIEAELTRRRHGAPLAEETPLSRTPKAELEAEAFRLNTAIAEAEREAAEKHRRFALVSERELKTPEEMNAEAEQRAIFAADRKVRNVFGSGDVKDLAAVQKGSELMKLFTMFYGYFSVQANAIIRSYYRGRSAKSWAPLASTILYRIFLTSALATLGRMMIFGEGDDDKDKYRKDAAGNKIEIPVVERILTQYAKNTLSTATGMAVGVRDIGNFYINMVFEGTDYGRGLALFGTAGSRAVQEVNTLSKLLMAREEVNEKADLAEAKRKARYDKMTERQKKKFDEEAKYRRPPRRIGWLDIARSAAMTGTYLTANKLGVTDTMTNAVFSTMQYIWDDDGRYDASLRNMLIRSAIFGKKPIKRVIPEKPKKEEKRRRRRTR